MTQLAVNTCFETGGNIAPDQQNPQAPVQRNAPPQFRPTNPAYEFEDDEMPPVRPQPQAFGQAGLRQAFGQQLNLEFSDEEKAYYLYKQEKGTRGSAR